MTDIDRKVHAALSWALDLIDMYDQRLAQLGDPPEKINSEVHLAGKAKARAVLASLPGGKADDVPARVKRIVQVEAQTCPRRTGEFGPWKREENLDWWERGRWASTEEEAKAEVAEFEAQYPGGSMGNTHWRWGEQPRTCSFCGGIHPDDAARLVREGWHIGPTDKAYKRYLEPTTHRQGGLIPPVKLYVQHFSPEQIEAFNQAISGLKKGVE